MRTTVPWYGAVIVRPPSGRTLAEIVGERIIITLATAISPEDEIAQPILFPFIPALVPRFRLTGFPSRRASGLSPEGVARPLTPEALRR
jgi:hypothetical protein